MDTQGPAILVNGLPGAGKTTLARALSRRLRLPLLSKDVIKEAHADVLGALPPDARPQRTWNTALGAAASETIWALLADAPGGAVVETPLPAGEVWHLVSAGLERAGVTRALQIWCEVPLHVARARDELRRPNRHPIHGKPMEGAEWEGRWALAEPLPLPDTLRVDTTGPVDLEGIVEWLVHAGAVVPQAG